MDDSSSGRGSGSSSGSDSDSGSPRPMTGFMFGNVDRRMRLQEDYLEKVSPDDIFTTGCMSCYGWATLNVQPQWP